MKKIFKQTVALLLCTIMLFSTFSVGAYAAATPSDEAASLSENQEKISVESVEDAINIIKEVVAFLNEADRSVIAEKIITTILPEDALAEISGAIKTLETVADFLRNGPSDDITLPDNSGINRLKEVAKYLEDVSAYLDNLTLSDILFTVLDRVVPQEIKDAAETVKNVIIYLNENSLPDIAGDIITNVIPSEALDALDLPLEIVGILRDAIVQLFGSGIGSLDESGIAGYLYDPSENCFYTASDPWQRAFGYNLIYDGASPLGLIIFDTKRFKFNYEGKKWMIQLWKGQYGAVFYGGEVGLYTKPADRFVDHYDCASDDDLLEMSFEFYQYKNRLFKDDGWEKQFSRPHEKCWWSTGFIPGNMIGRFDRLRMVTRITMKDYEMLRAFTSSVAAQGTSYETNGLDVIITY